MELTKALSSPKEEREYAHLEGAISGDYLWAYPPGIPLVCPGERVGRKTVELLLRLEREQCRLLTGGDGPRGCLAVVKTREK